MTHNPLSRLTLPVLSALILTLSPLPASRTAEAANYDLDAIFPNTSFESGLANWNYTGAGVNSDTYLTNSEWAAQSWSSSSPFYTDANLAIYYPGRPWGLNPAITHIDQTGFPGDPTTTILAPVGSRFVGSRQDGYEGHYRRAGSEPPQPPGGFYDTNWQLTSTSIAGPFLAGDTFTLTAWGVRGRVNADWGQQNNSSAGSASTLTVRLVGGSYVADTMTFTNWSADGQWASQNLTWQLTSNAASIQIRVTGQNKNHDRFVAYDAGEPVVPVESSTWSRIKTLNR